METKKIPTREEFERALDIVSRYLWSRYYRAAELMDAAYKRGDVERAKELENDVNKSMELLFEARRAVRYVKNLNL